MSAMPLASSRLVLVRPGIKRNSFASRTNSSFFISKLLHSFRATYSRQFWPARVHEHAWRRARVGPGTVTVTCDFDDKLTQQHALFHGGVMATLVDVACGYAALSVMPADREVLTVEFKVNFLKPAKTNRLIAVGRVLHAGRTLTVCEGSVYDATRTHLLARMT